MSKQRGVACRAVVGRRHVYIRCCAAAERLTSTERGALAVGRGGAQNAGGTDVRKLFVEDNASGDGVQALAEKLRRRLPVARLDECLILALMVGVGEAAVIVAINPWLGSWHDCALLKVSAAITGAEWGAALPKDLG